MKKRFRVWAEKPLLSDAAVEEFFAHVNRCREAKIAQHRRAEQRTAKVIADIIAAPLAIRNSATDRAAELNRAFGHEHA